MSANNIVVIEEQEDGSFKAYHKDIESGWKEIFTAKDMRCAVEKCEQWLDEFELRD